MIIRGDNLERLKALLPRSEGAFKCIYIDPPYNTGNEGWVYNDNVNNPKIKKWLCMMYPRLKLLPPFLQNNSAFEGMSRAVASASVHLDS